MWQDQEYESLVEDFKFWVFYTTIWHFPNATHFDANPIWIEFWLQSYEQFISTENNIKQRNLNCFFAIANISKTISATIDKSTGSKQTLVINHWLIKMIGTKAYDGHWWSMDHNLDQVHEPRLEPVTKVNVHLQHQIAIPHFMPFWKNTPLVATSGF